MKKNKTRFSYTYNPDFAALLLRVGLAAVFAYAAIDAFREPNAWISFVPPFMAKFVSLKVALDAMSVGQLILAAALVWGRYLRFTASIAAAMLLGIIVLNINTLLITFRDVGLLFAAVALIFMDKNGA